MEGGENALGEKRNKNCKFTIEQEKQITQEYISGKSAQEIADKWDYNISSILKIVRFYGGEVRTLSEARNNYLKRELDETVFEVIDTPEKTYWIGVFYSDGFIEKTNLYTNYLGLSVKSSDIGWLKKLQNFLCSNTNIHTYVQSTGYKPGTKYSRFQVGSNKLVADLEKLGVVEHKTKKIDSLPKIDFLDDFCRGYIDGDGSLCSAYPNLRVCGNKPFLEEMGEYLGVKYRIKPDRSIFDLCYNTKESTYLEKRLYKNATVYLDRKYELAKRSFNSPITLEDVMKNPE